MQNKIYVVFEPSDTVQRQRERINALLDEIRSLRRKCDDLSLKYGAEVYANMELVDLCRENGIPFRKHLDGRTGRHSY